MLYVPAEDDALESLLSAEIPSEVIPGVRYRLTWRLGEGGMGVVFYASRVDEDGEAPVVIKMLRPSFVRRAGPTAALTVKKEAIALGRLNERVPPTPFVVRFIDTGVLPIVSTASPMSTARASAPPGGEIAMELPWLALEYIHGGAEGTTLTQRVEHCIKTTGVAFDTARAGHAVECLTSGLAAVHEVGVIHRDLKPDNVLCCGFGEGEIFKLADFGVARPAGVTTFAGAIVGTPGFVAPELLTGDPNTIGPWSDVFSLAAVIYYVLTGEEYFPAKNPGEAIVMAVNPARRSVREAKGLSPDLRAREQACRSIDFALACATSMKIDARPRRADALGAMLLPWLVVESHKPSIDPARLDFLRDDEDKTRLAKWSWTARRPHARGTIVRSVAWDGDGRCMVATNQGLAFWSGSTWSDVSLAGLPNPSAIRFVQRVHAGEWLVGGDDATFATIRPEGVTAVRRFDQGALPRFDRVAGDLDDLAVLTGGGQGSPPVLCTLIGKRWLKPLPLPDVAAISSIARFEDARFLLAGRAVDGGGYAAIYAPLDAEVTRLRGPEVRAYLACAGQHDRKLGIVAGADGAVIARHGDVTSIEVVDGGFDLSSASIDPVGRAFVAAAGRIWMRRTTGIGPGARTLTTARWDPLYTDLTQGMPIVSLFTDLGVVAAMTADGGIIEGRVIRATIVDDGES